MPEMPEMPSMEGLTGGWGEFTMPEGWGSFSFDDFGSPMTGSWGDLGTNSDWGSAFSDMQKQIQEGMGTSNIGNGDWPPASFKDLESAFNSQKSGLGEAGMNSGIGDLQSQYESMFGANGQEGFTGIPSLESAEADLDGKFTLSGGTSSLVNSVSGKMQLNTISGLISSWSGSASQVASFDNLGTLPTIGDEITLKGDMFGEYQSRVGSLQVNINTDTKYNGSLFKK